MSAKLLFLPLYLNSADESGGSGATETVTRAIDEQENKFDDFIQNILKSSATGGAGDEDGGAGDAALRAQRSGPPALSLAEKLLALSTVRGDEFNSVDRLNNGATCKVLTVCVVYGMLYLVSIR